MRETSSLLSFDQDSSIKTLGICWNPKTDQFLFRISPQEPTTTPMTKRSILSQIARLFDPVGWLAPIIINAKILMQSLWKLKHGWDEPLPLEIQNQWTILRSNMEGLSKLTINRFFMQGTDLICPSLNRAFHSTTKFCLAGFCDASQKLTPLLCTCVCTTVSPAHHPSSLQNPVWLLSRPCHFRVWSSVELNFWLNS